MQRIYFDNSATTRVDDQVYEAMREFYFSEFGNPSSIHSFGQAALQAVDEAREKIAKFFNCQSSEIIFTAGATESNNLVIQGLAKIYKNRNPHFITSKIEHPAVLKVYKNLEKQGFEVSYLDVNEQGVIKIDQLRKFLKLNTVLVSVMYVNNEVGSIQPIKKISELLEKFKEKRTDKELPIYFHTDAVQAVNYLSCVPNYLGVDFLSFSGHKIYGPKGIGGLFIKKGIKLEPVNYGGGQEYGIRPGTLNVPGIVGLGKAIELVEEVKKTKKQKIKILKDKLVKGLQEIEEIKFNSSEDGLPNIINISFKNAEGESILMMLDMQGIAISTGSACSSGALEPSHVLTSMGLQPEWTHGSIRISLGKYNTEQEVNQFLKSIKEIIEKLREMAP